MAALPPNSFLPSSVWEQENLIISAVRNAVMEAAVKGIPRVLFDAG